MDHQAIGIVWGDDDADGNATAVGVRFVSTPLENGTVGGPIWEVATTNEVIVASGAIGVCPLHFPTRHATDWHIIRVRISSNLVGSEIRRVPHPFADFLSTKHSLHF